MNISDYTAEAATFDRHRPDRLMDALVHGLAAEAAEVLEAVQAGDMGVLLLELGDVAWGLSQIADCLTLDADLLAQAEGEIGPASPALSSVAIGLCVRVGQVSGLMEKWYRENHTPGIWPQMRRSVLRCWSRWAWLVRCAGFTPEQVRDANIEKLTVRYGKEAA